MHRSAPAIFVAALACLSFVPSPASADIPAPYNTQEAPAPPPSAEDAVAGMRLPDGFSVNVFAAEPDVHQPVNLHFDARGRLWVAECYTYAEREVNFADDQRDRIVILEDTDGDGRSDTRTVFWDEAQKLTSIVTGFGGVWATCAPQLLFIPDADGDDVPDGEPQVILDGFDDDGVRHNIVNGLMWGPDGWLYGRHGIQATSLVGKPEAPDYQRTPINCGIWRYHPQREVFEVVCRGGTNSWGFDYDTHGQMFFINTVIGHLWHVVPGAYYQRMYGVHDNPHLYRYIEQTADHVHWATGEDWTEVRQHGISDATSAVGGGHAHCGLMLYQGGNWPDEFRGDVFTCNFHGLRINRDVLEREGCGFVARHADDFLHVADPWFRGIELRYGPDGAVYVADWSDIGECHENDGVHRTSGRVYRVSYDGGEVEGPASLADLSSEQLVELQFHKNEFFVRTARRLLQERAVAGTDQSYAIKQLKSVVRDHSDVTRRLRALWCLYSMGEVADERLQPMLDDPNEHVRVWAVRLICDDGDVSEQAATRFAEMAATEQSGLVRLFLASSLPHLPTEMRWKLAAALASHQQDADDRMQPLMVWYGVEPIVSEQPQQAAFLAKDSQLPIVREFIARRLLSELRSNPSTAEPVIHLLHRSQQAADAHDLLNGMAAAVRGWRQAPMPAGWETASAKLMNSDDEEIRNKTRELAVVFGDGRAMEELLEIASDAEADVDSRRNAIATLVENRAEAVVPVLKKLLGDRSLGVQAAQGLASFPDPDGPKLLLNTYLRRMRTFEKPAAIDAMTQRPEYALALLHAIEDGTVDADVLKATHARQLRGMGDQQIHELVTRLWGEVRETPEEKRQLIARYEAQFSDEELERADIEQGRLLYKKHCASCHVLYGEGGKIGPDLTGSNRKNVHYLLENLIDPSAIVARSFQVSVIALEDGRVITGVITDRNDETLTVQTEKDPVTIPRSDINAIRTTTQSLMPDGLLKPLSAEQLRDLIAYLRNA